MYRSLVQKKKMSGTAALEPAGTTSENDGEFTELQLISEELKERWNMSKVATVIKAIQIFMPKKKKNK